MHRYINCRKIRFNEALITSLLLLLSLSSYSQSKNAEENRKALKIKSQRGYNFKIVNDEIVLDSSMTVMRRYNNEGHRTETAVFKNEIFDFLYSFEYTNDTTLSNYTKSSGPDTLFQFKVLLEYDKFGNATERRSINSHIEFNPKTKNKYNKNGQLIRSYTKFKGRKIRDAKYEYDESGNQTAYIRMKPSKVRYELSYGAENKHTHTHKFKNGKKSLIYYADFSIPSSVTKHYTNDKRTILGADGYIKLTNKDTLSIESTYDDCILIKKKQYLNGKLHAFQKFHYSPK